MGRIIREASPDSSAAGCATVAGDLPHRSRKVGAGGTSIVASYLGLSVLVGSQA
jgi:hypothetical protein